MAPRFVDIPKFQDESGEFLILVKEFVAFIKRHHRPDDKVKGIRKSNMVREFGRGGVRDHAGQQAVTVQAAIRYIFNQAPKMRVCQALAAQTEAALLNNGSKAASVPRAAALKMLKVIRNKCMQIEKATCPTGIKKVNSDYR